MTDINRSDLPANTTDATKVAHDRITASDMSSPESLAALAVACEIAELRARLSELLRVEVL